MEGRNRTLAALLALFLGGLGVHKFYLGDSKWGIVYILFSWTFIPAIVAFIEGLQFFLMSDAEFQEKYGE